MSKPGTRTQRNTVGCRGSFWRGCNGSDRVVFNPDNDLFHVDVAAAIKEFQTSNEDDYSEESYP